MVEGGTFQRQGPAAAAAWDRETILREVGRCRCWFHQIPLGQGVVTPGVKDCGLTLEALDSIGLPVDLGGRRVLDIGCCDGYFSFEMERRGAQVVALDRVSPKKNGFHIAHKILQSHVEHVLSNVYDLRPDGHGTFDLILFLGVFYHLRNPLWALDRIRSVIRPGGFLFVESHFLDRHFIRPDRSSVPLSSVAAELEESPLMQFNPGDVLGGDDSDVWAPNRECLVKMLGEAQFRVLDVWQEGTRGVIRAESVRNQRLEHMKALDYGCDAPDEEP